MTIDPAMFDTWTTTDGMLPAPCRMVATLHVKGDGKARGGYTTKVDLAGWDRNAEPVVILSNGALGSPTVGMEITDVRPA